MNSINECVSITQLDLNPIKVKLMHGPSGEGWTKAKADAVEVEYRRFLYLTKKYPDEQISPSVEVDVFWHYHILDTMKYAQDCEQVFGYFLHHYPYVGLSEDSTEQDRMEVSERTGQLYAAEFGHATSMDEPQLLPAAASQARCASPSKPAWCASPGKLADTAWCAAPSIQVLTAMRAALARTTDTAWCASPNKPMAIAWCASPSKRADSAWCAAPNKQADAAWCASPSKQADAAWCASPSKRADSAWCASPSKRADAAWCASPSKRADLACCASPSKATDTAWCAAPSKAACPA